MVVVCDSKRTIVSYLKHHRKGPIIIHVHHYVAIKSIMAPGDGMVWTVLLHVLERILVSQRQGTLKGEGMHFGSSTVAWSGDYHKRSRGRGGPRREAFGPFVGWVTLRPSYHTFPIALKGNTPLVAKRALFMCERVDMWSIWGHKGKIGLNLHSTFSDSQAYGLKKAYGEWV